MAFGGFFTSGNAYLPAYVPAYVDWRHTAGYGGRSEYDLEDLPNALSKKLDKTMNKQAVRAHAERMKYASKYKKFREKVVSEMEKEDLRRPAVELIGKELNPDKDLIYVTYVIDENSEDGMKKIQDFAMDAFHEYGLGEYFRAEPEGSIPEEDDEEGIHEAGDIAVFIWPRRDHDYPQFERSILDFWEPEEEEDGGGGF
jgi:hypothetical protein